MSIQCDRSVDHRLDDAGFDLVSRQSGCDHIVARGERHLAAGYFADFCREAIVDLVPNHQKSEQSSVALRSQINGLNECLIKMMLSQPPMAGCFAVFVQ